MRWFALLIATSALGADFSGTWIGTLEGRNGNVEDLAFQFVQKGAELTGKQYGDFESTAIVKGTISGDLVMFVLVRQEQSGNEINQTKIRFSGRMVGSEIELTRERESSTRSGSGASAALRNNPRQTFRLKRLVGGTETLSLKGKWMLSELRGKAMAAGGRIPYIEFPGQGGRVQGSGGCNRFGGSFKTTEATMEIGPLAATRMACVGPAMQLEEEFLGVLGLKLTYKLEHGELTLREGNVIVMKLKR